MHACPLVFSLMAWGSGLKEFLYLGSVNDVMNAWLSV